MQQRNLPLAFLGIVLLLSFVLLAGCPGGGTAPESTGITAKSAAGGIEVSWNPSQQADTVGYNLYRSREAGALGDKINPVVITSTSYKDVSVSNGAVYYYTVRAVNSKGEENPSTEQASATAVINPPTDLSIHINGGAQYTGSRDVTLALSAANAAECRFSNDGSSWSSWEPYALSKPWELSSGDGYKTVYYECKDASGNIAYPVTASITLDTASLQITVYSPQEGGSYTSPFDLEFMVKDNLDEQISCTGTLDGVTFAFGHVDSGKEETMSIYADPGQHTISGTCTDGINTETKSITFTITEQPSVELHIQSGSGYVDSRYVTLDITASGATQCRFANEQSGWSSWLPYAQEVQWTLSSGDGRKTVYAECRNADGQTSEEVSDSVILDTSHGTKISIEIDNGDDWTNSRDVKLGLYCFAADKCRYRNENDDWSAWESYTTKKYWTLSSGEGDKTVHYNCKDANGNDLGSESAEIYYSKKEPVPPSSLSIKINNGASHTSSREVTLKLSAKNADACRYKNSADVWTSYEDYTTSRQWTLSAGDGNKKVYYQCKNDYGREETHATIYLDTEGPGKITDLSGYVDVNDAVHLTWSRPSGSDIHEYETFRSTSGMGLMTKIGSTQTTSYKDTSTTAGYTYSYTVRAVDSAGNEGKDSNVATIEIPEEEVGGDTDVHGCLTSAGYTWCESLGECIRPWETECPE